MLKQTIIEMRAEETAQDEIKSHKYRELLSRLCKIQDEMKKLVPSNSRKLFYKLIIDHASIRARMGEIEAKEAFKQGFTDGLEIAKLLVSRK